MVNQIIKDLLSAGLTQTEISERASIPQSRISELANGKQQTVNYEAGKRLEALAKEVKAKQ